MLQWYCVIRHPAGPTPVISNDEHRHWLGLSRVLIERTARGDRTLIEVRAYRDRSQAESDAIAGSAPRRAPAATTSLVEVTAWFQTEDYGEFQAIRQDVLLQLLGVVERAGTSLAYPTQTVFVGGPAGSSNDLRMERRA